MKTANSLAFLALLSSCDFTEESHHWTDQLSPSGPCWQVDLSDGLDENASTEIHALYDCLNQRGELDDLHAVDDSFDAQSRGGNAIGAELGRAINAAADIEIDLLGLGGPMLERLSEPDPLLRWMHLSTELIHGASWSSQQDGNGDIPPPSAGVIHPLLTTLQALARSELDSSNDSLARLSDTIDGPTLDEMACSLIALEDTDTPELVTLRENLVPHFGEMLVNSHDASNDHWSEGTGDSIRDLVTAVVVPPSADAESARETLAPILIAMLESNTLRYQIQDVLWETHANGILTPLPEQLRQLAVKDSGGGNLTASEDSALTSLIRLLARGNTRVECSIDLWLIELEIELGNMSVSILRELAQRNPANMETGISLLAGVLGTNLSEASLSAIAASGLCPILDERMVADLDAIDRFNDDGMEDLLVVFLDILTAFHDAGTDDDLIVELVDLFTTLYEFDIHLPLGEFLRDTGHTDAAEDTIELASLLIDPSELDTTSCPSSVEPLTLDDTWQRLLSHLEERESLDGDGSLMVSAMESDGTWAAMEALGPLLADPDAIISGLPSLLADALRPNEDSTDTSPTSDALIQLLNSPDFTTHLLQVLENEAWRTGLQDDTGPNGGMLAWYTDLIRSGTFEILLERFDYLVNILEAVREDLYEDESEETE